MVGVDLRRLTGQHGHGPAQIEATVSSLRLDASGQFVVIEAKAVRVHADTSIVMESTSHSDTSAWSLLIYNFRHCFGLGPRLGTTRRAEYRNGPRTLLAGIA